MTAMLYKKIVSAFLLVPLFAVAQDKGVIDPKGDMFFESQCYAKALNEYKKVAAKQPNNMRLKRRIAEVILLDESPRGAAIPYIDAYVDYAQDDVEAYYLAAKAHYHAHDFSNARKFLENYKSMVTVDDDVKKADVLTDWINNAQRMLKDSLKCVMVNMGEMVNTAYSEINPLIMPDDKTLFFSSDAKYNSQGVVNYFNIMFTENKDLMWTKAKAVGGMVNTLYDEYVSGFYNKGMYYASNANVEFGIYECDYLGNGRFSEGSRLLPPIDMKGDETSAWGSANGDTIFFAASNTKGDLDIYYSIKHNQLWCEPRPVPGEINVEGYDENYPQLANNGKRLYFSSNRPGTMGGMDLYYSDLDEKSGQWKKPVHLKYPINDTYDNLTVSYTQSGRYAYISAVRPGGLGGRDIYAVINDEIMPTTALFKCYLSIKAKPKPLPLTDMPVITVTDEYDEVVAAVKMKLSTSTFVLTLDPGKYTLTIESDNTKTYTEQLTIVDKFYDQQNAIEKMILLEPNN